MKEVFALIEDKQQEFAHLPLFKFMQDTSLAPRQRLAFAPCFSHFVMTFKDLNKYVFRQEPTNNKIQALINQHTHEDDHHWVWFLEDIKKLGFNQSPSLNDSLKFLWSEETKTQRLVTHQLYLLTHEADPIQKLVVMEAIEATSNVFLSATTQVTQELKVITNKKYRFFGEYHLDIESNHTINSTEAEDFLDDIQLTPEARQHAFELVEKVFELFSELMNELLVYAQNHQIAEPNTNIVKFERPLQAA